MVEKEFLSWKDIENLTECLYKKLWKWAKKEGLDIEKIKIITIARGGLVIATLLSHKIGIKDVFVLNTSSYQGTKKLNSPRISFKFSRALESYLKDKVVVIVDDISDSGETLAIVESYVKKLKPKVVKTATLHFKEKLSKFKPSFYCKTTEKWVVYPWEAFGKEGKG